jgi:hypothetical protein
MPMAEDADPEMTSKNRSALGLSAAPPKQGMDRVKPIRVPPEGISTPWAPFSVPSSTPYGPPAPAAGSAAYADYPGVR